MNIVVMVDGVAYRLVPAIDMPGSMTPIGDVFRTRLRNSLKGDGIEYLEELLSKTEGEILRIPNVGRKGLIVINEVLRERLSLRVGSCAPLPTQ